MSDTKVQRQSNFELLRIIAMFFIIFHHLAIHGIFELNSDAFINNIWYCFTYSLGKIGVSLFVLISGYFLCERKKFGYEKLVKLWLQILSYSVVIVCVYYIIKKRTISLRHLYEILTPISSNQWWFASAYFIMFILSPFYNMFLRTLSRNTFKLFLTVVFVIWFLLSTLLGVTEYGNELTYFLVLYAVGAYLRKYGKELKFGKMFYMAVSLLLIALVTVLLYLCRRFNWENRIILRKVVSFVNINSVFVFFISVFIFIFFMKINIGTKKFINFVSQASFGVYLIHDNNIIRLLIWWKIFKVNEFFSKQYFVPYTIIVSLIVFISCTIIELIRIYAFENLYMKLVDKALPSVKKVVLKIYYKVAKF